MWSYNYSNELYHWGIKGMKWGVRRYQNKDSSLTPAGEKRYYEESDKKKKKSKRRLSLENKYKSKGLNNEEAELAADKRIKIEKTIAVMAGVTVAACAAYYLKNKYIADRTDQILKAGTSFHNLDAIANPRPGEHLYVNYRQNDRNFFNGRFAVGKLQKSGHVFEHRIEAVEDVKIPSLKMRQSVFKQLCEKDPEFRKAMSRHSGVDVNSSPKKIYKKMWAQFGDKDTPYFNEAKSKYFKALKEKGYAAVVDEWDTKASVFRSDAPLILLDTNHKSLGKMTIREMTPKDILTAQANSYNYSFKNNILNMIVAPHTNHFKETSKHIDKYSKMNSKNRKYIETAIFKEKYQNGLIGNNQFNAKRAAIMGDGKEIARVGKLLSENKNMSLKEAKNIARKQTSIRNKVDNAVLTGIAVTPTFAVGYVYRQAQIDNYRSKHPNTKLSDKEILKLYSVT